MKDFQTVAENAVRANLCMCQYVPRDLITRFCMVSDVYYYPIMKNWQWYMYTVVQKEITRLYTQQHQTRMGGQIAFRRKFQQPDRVTYRVA